MKAQFNKGTLLLSVSAKVKCLESEKTLIKTTAKILADHFNYDKAIEENNSLKMLAPLGLPIIEMRDDYREAKAVAIEVLKHGKEMKVMLTPCLNKSELKQTGLTKESLPSLSVSGFIIGYELDNKFVVVNGKDSLSVSLDVLSKHKPVLKSLKVLNK